MYNLGVGEHQQLPITGVPDQWAAEPRAIIDGTSQVFPTEADKFNALADEWHAHNIGRATLDFQHSSYHQIIGMGKLALPHLLERIQQREPGWIYALKCITGELIGAGLRGDDAIAAWVDWGRSQGIIRGRI